MKFLLRDALPVGADDDLDLWEGLLQGLPVFFLEGTERLDAVSEMNGVYAKVRQGPDALDEFFRPDHRGASRAVDHTDEVQGFVGSVGLEGALALSEISQAACRGAAQVLGRVRAGQYADTGHSIILQSWNTFFATEVTEIAEKAKNYLFGHGCTLMTTDEIEELIPQSRLVGTAGCRVIISHARA